MARRARVRAKEVKGTRANGTEAARQGRVGGGAVAGCAGRDMQKGATVRFEVEMSEEHGRLNSAVNAALS